VRAIEVSVDQSRIDPPACERLEIYGTKDRLTTAVAAELASRGRYAKSGELMLHITLVLFRLRGDRLALWVGTSVGPDLVGVTVDVRRAEQVEQTYMTDTSSIFGGIAYKDANKRLDRLIAELARRIVGGLRPAV
jgi:hypothetical protein